jgi:hypothetical protein
MKTKLVAVLFLCIGFSFTGCKKDDDKKTPTAEPSNFDLKIRNWIGYDGSTCTKRKLGYVTVEPVDGSSAAKGYSFNLASGSQIIVGVTLPKDGAYKVRVMTEENGPFVGWDNLALTKGGNGYANIGSGGDDIKEGSVYDGVKADDTSMGCQ